MTTEIHQLRPTIQQTAPPPSDLVFWFWGRPLRIVRAIGSDKAAPVIVEEMAGSEFAIAGQFALWSTDSIRRVLARNSMPRQPKTAGSR